MTNWKRLSEPFPASDVEWRLAQAGEKNGQVWGKVLAYITARAIQERLDEVFGVGGWKNEYRPGPEGGVVCRIYFQNDAGEWVWREDGAENTDIEAVKGGISSALKRAGAALGIGRYLYNLPEGWAEVADRGMFSGKTKEGKWFKWNPPELPPWALPTPKVETSRAAAAGIRKAADGAPSLMWESIEAKIEAGLTDEEARRLIKTIETQLGKLAVPA